MPAAELAGGFDIDICWINGSSLDQYVGSYLLGYFHSNGTCKETIEKEDSSTSMVRYQILDNVLVKFTLATSNNLVEQGSKSC